MIILKPWVKARQEIWSVVASGEEATKIFAAIKNCGGKLLDYDVPQIHIRFNFASKVDRDKVLAQVEEDKLLFKSTYVPFDLEAKT